MFRVGIAVLAVAAALIIAGAVSATTFVFWLGVALGGVAGVLMASVIVFSPKSERSRTASPEP